MKQSWFKLVGVFMLCLLFRLLPGRPPNVEPILASQMPIARQFGGFVGFCFGAFSIILFDFVTGTFGQWTLITAPAYGLLGIGGAWYLKNRARTRHFVSFAIAGTLFYDAVTGLTVGPLFFGQPFMAALLGQIPFTLMHLLGNVAFAVVLSSALLRYLQKETVINSPLWIPRRI